MAPPAGYYLHGEQWRVLEVELRSDAFYRSPFADVEVWANVQSPTGRARVVPAYFDGDGTWRLRLCFDAPGRWRYRVESRPSNSDFERQGAIEVAPRAGRGYLRSTPGSAWGFHYDSGEPVFIFGDTVYNLFGMAYCGADVSSFLRRRASQGFNLLRVRLPVSPFHPPDGYSDWQTRRTWPWGGSEQAPLFDRFNLDYFRTVDAVVREAEDLGIGLEMIMEAWGFEYPFNNRTVFTAEWEELWLRYLIARYDAFACVYFWTPLNEYEYYPDGTFRHKPVADRWAIRIAHLIKGDQPGGKDDRPGGHVVAVHNGPREPAFSERFRADPHAIDAILFQDWGTRDAQLGWLAAGIEEQIGRSLAGWEGSAVFAEWGYERNPDLPLLIPSHAYCDADHSRRGAWRGTFCGMGIIHGFENSWGPFQVLDQDQPGLEHLLHLRRFFLEVVPFWRLRPAPEVLADGGHAPGRRPLALATAERDVVAVYLPAGGDVRLAADAAGHRARWFAPRTGELSEARGDGGVFGKPSDGERPDDWVLVLTR